MIIKELNEYLEEDSKRAMTKRSESFISVTVALTSTMPCPLCLHPGTRLPRDAILCGADALQEILRNSMVD